MDSKTKKRSGFTLIELVIVIVLLGIIGTIGAMILGPIINLAFFAPGQTNIEQVASRIVEYIAEGDASAKGLRMIKTLSAGSATSLSYFDVDNTAVTLSWNSGTKKLNRTPPGSMLPLEYPGHQVQIDGQTPGVIFKYYDSNNSLLSTPLATPANVVRVQLDWVATSGDGTVKGYGNKFLINSGIAIRQF